MWLPLLQESGTSPVHQIALCAAAVFLAAVLRGYTGFGFALAAVPMLSLVIRPALVVPLVLCLEVAASAQILPGLRHEAHFRSIGWLTLGALIGIPFGVLELSTRSADSMRALIALVVLLSVPAVSGGLRFTRELGAGAAIVVGAFSGLLTGATAMGGPPVILFYLGSRTAIHVGRASLMFYFFLIDMVAIVLAIRAGLLGSTILVMALVCLPTLFVGQAIGARMFRSALQRHYRKVAMLTLTAIGLAALAQSLRYRP